jgi:hypothetical protein
MKTLILLFTLLPVLVMPGCFSQTRSETTKTDRITFTAQVPVATAEGMKVVPVSGSIRRVGTEEEQTRTAPDTEAITAAITQSLAAMLPAATNMAFPWTNILTGAGAAFTAATTGYLALKKREQMKVPTARKDAA